MNSIAQMNAAGKRYTYDLPAYGLSVGGIPELKVTIIGSKIENVKVPAVVSLNQDTCISSAAASYADLVVIPAKRLSWGHNPPVISGSTCVGFVAKVKLTADVMGRKRETISDVYVYNDFTIATHLMLGLRDMKVMGTKISLWDSGSMVKFI